MTDPRQLMDAVHAIFNTHNTSPDTILRELTALKDRHGEDALILALAMEHMTARARLGVRADHAVAN